MTTAKRRLIDLDETWKLFVEHYWDSFQKDRDLILNHVNAVLNIPPLAAASPSLTEEEIKKLMVTIPKKEFATASDDYMRGYQSGVNAHRNAVLALIRGERAP